MADQILNNTLAGTMTTPTQPALPPTPQGLQVPTIGGTDKTLNTDIQRLQAAQQQPNALMDFQKVMQLTSQQAYKDRQTSELKIEGQAFDPSKVSGGTFATIIGNLEAQRGADVGKIYASTLSAYASAQDQITNRLQFLQQLQESKRQFEAEFKLKKQQIKQQMKLDKEGAKLSKKKLEQDQKNWEREFALSSMKARNEVDSFDFLKKNNINIEEVRAALPPLPSTNEPMSGGNIEEEYDNYLGKSFPGTSYSQNLGWQSKR